MTRAPRNRGHVECRDRLTDIQLHRYNVATLQQTQQSLKRWSKELSTPERPVTGYFIRLSFEDVPDAPLRRFLNEIPTSLALSAEQVERLVTVGRELLRGNADYRRLVAELQGRVGAGVANPVKAAAP